jgi:hypothetical protein
VLSAPRPSGPKPPAAPPGLKAEQNTRGVLLTGKAATKALRSTASIATAGPSLMPHLPTQDATAEYDRQ